MENKVIVTIGREFGSGGHDVGKKLAEKLGIKFYDEVLADRASQNTGLYEGYVRDNEEKAPDLAMESYAAGFNPFQSNPSVEIQTQQFELIKELAAEGSCVIVGRAADYVLKDEPHVNIFIFAPTEERIRRITENIEVYKNKFPEGDYDERALLKTIKAYDKRRRKYYEFYTDKKWGDRDSYDLLLDTSRTGIDGAVSIIETYINESRNKGIISDL